MPISAAPPHRFVPLAAARLGVPTLHRRRRGWSCVGSQQQYAAGRQAAAADHADSSIGDLPLTARLNERVCGVWMVELTTGTITGFLRFDDYVQEIFDVDPAQQRSPRAVQRDPAHARDLRAQAIRVVRRRRCVGRARHATQCSRR